MQRERVTYMGEQSASTQQNEFSFLAMTELEKTDSCCYGEVCQSCNFLKVHMFSLATTFFFWITPVINNRKCLHSFWIVSSQGVLRQQTTEAEEGRTRRGQRYKMEKKREKVITDILGSHCVCLCSLYRDVTMVEISVTLCWHSMEWVRRKGGEREKGAEWEREKKKRE